MKNRFLISVFLLFGLSGFGQSIKINHDGEPGGTKSAIIQTVMTAEAGINLGSAQWANSVRPHFSRSHATPEVQAMKQSLMREKLNSMEQGNKDTQDTDRSSVTPLIGSNFEGNWSLVGTPPDNSMAISNGGFIVTANNDGVEYYNNQGSLLNVIYWSDFFGQPGLTSIIYDPKVIYDSQADRFVMVVLHGSTASTSQVLVCFSKTNNPQTGGGWWVYNLTGNPLNNNCWFDYPNLGVSNNEIYITGNLFTSGNNNFNQAVVYQIQKTQGYNGQALNWVYWANLSNSPYAAFTLVPASFGHQGNYGPGIYFVSNSAGGANSIRLWNLTDDLTGNAQLTVNTVSTTAYSPAASAPQAGTGDDLDNGDCRIQNAFFLNGIIHFVFCSNAGQGWNGINYNRLTVATNTNQSSILGQVGTADYCYPAVASFATSATDKSVMIAFLRVTPSTFPEVRVVNCDNNMQWSATTLVKSGETFVNFISGSGVERWGDYSGISRRHNSSDARIWLAGSYGANIPGFMNNTWKTWIAEVFAQGQSGSAPVANFSANPTSGNAPMSVSFTDLSTNTPTSWSWSFPGGSPASSGQQNPSVNYSTPGTYSVTLTATNSFGNDVHTKTNYIQVSQAGSAPVAEFTANPTFGNSPLTVNFTDLSTNSPNSWSWSFPGGSPSSSSAANPTVTYNSPGLYSVTLTSSNSFGNNSQTKTNYIQVNQPVGLLEINPEDGGSKIYPNPVVDLMHLVFMADSGEEVTIELMDNNGRLVKLLYRDIPRQGENRLTFNRSALSPGLYFIQIRTQNKVLHHEKVVIAD